GACSRPAPLWQRRVLVRSGGPPPASSPACSEHLPCRAPLSQAQAHDERCRVRAARSWRPRCARPLRPGVCCYLVVLCLKEFDMVRCHRVRSAFTLIELLVVIAIIAILIG